MITEGAIIQIAVTLGGIFAGLFGLMRYFFRYIEKKNGHLERVAQRFADASEKSATKYQEASKAHAQAVHDMSKELQRANDNHLNTLGVIDTNTKMLGRAMEVIREK